MDDTLAYMTQQHWFKQCRSGRFFFKEMNTIIQQVCIKLIKSDKDFNNVKLSFSNNCCSFEISITQIIFTEYREWTTAHCIVWDRSSLLFVQISMFYTVYIVNIHICLLYIQIHTSSYSANKSLRTNKEQEEHKLSETEKKCGWWSKER